MPTSPPSDDPPSMNALDCLLLASKTACDAHGVPEGFACIGETPETAGVCYGRVRKAWLEGHRLAVE